jgi:hypothetical protein
MVFIRGPIRLDLSLLSHPPNFRPKDGGTVLLRNVGNIAHIHVVSTYKNRSNINFMSNVNTHKFYLQEELDMIKISKEASKLPDWLLCTKTMIPDFVARDPKVSVSYGWECVMMIMCHSAIYSEIPM